MKTKENRGKGKGGNKRQLGKNKRVTGKQEKYERERQGKNERRVRVESTSESHQGEMTENCIGRKQERNRGKAKRFGK